MRISTITVAFATIMLHLLLLLTAYTLRDTRALSDAVQNSNFLGARTYSYQHAQAFNADEDRTMRVLVPNKYK